MEERYQNEQPLTIDGVKIDFNAGWVHMRKSNTEPIIRVYTEADSQEKATELCQRFQMSCFLLLINRNLLRCLNRLCDQRYCEGSFRICASKRSMNRSVISLSLQSEGFSVIQETVAV